MANERTDQVVALLKSIDASLKRLVAGTGAGGPAAADDRDLDSKYGDPEVRFTPRDWHGENCKGRHYSECSADFLDLLASSLDYFARKSEEQGATASNGKPKAEYERRDAARARGWARRIRANGGPAKPQAGPAEQGDPFERSEWPDEEQPF